jgi:UPF0755 protein
VADSERTAEEREAARLERERRRAVQEGSAPAPAPAPAAPAPLSPAPAAPEPLAAEPLAAEPLAAEPLAPEDDGDSRADTSLDSPSFDDEPHLEDAPEVASGTRRVGWRERTRAAEDREAPASPKRPRRGHSRRARILVVLALVLAAALIWFLVELFQPFHGSGHGSVVVRIPAHSSSSQVGDLLERDDVVASSFFFDLRATLAGDRGKLLAGTYHLRHDMSYGAALKALTTLPKAAPVRGVTIVPGRTRSEINARLRQEGVRGSYLGDTRHSPLLNPVTYGAPRRTPSLEGFLYPDTYQLRVPVSIPALVSNQLTTFRKRFATVGLGYARSKHLTGYDVLIIASMVEAEAQTAHDRPLIASVIYNRLRDNMPLQIDATTRYATGNYTKPLTQSQLNSSSPYNTRIHKGLTPTPIDSPSLPSIQAAAHPARTNFLYFVVKPCGNGEHVFASNYNQFLGQVQRYYSARSAHGGRSPTHC